MKTTKEIAEAISEDFSSKANLDGLALEIQLALDKERAKLRDAFAAAALEGLLANPDTNLQEGFTTISNEAYAYADAMLKERKQK